MCARSARTRSRFTTPQTAGNFNGPGGIIAGDPDPLRMFDAANGGQIAWFLPFALIGGVVSLWRWRDDNVLRASVVLMLGWVVLFGGVFSYTQGIYHSYYTAALAPGIAALVGMSSVALPDLIQRHKGWLIAAAGIAGVTLYTQLVVAGRFDDFFEWVTPITVVTVLMGLILTVVAAWYKRLPVLVGIAVIVGGLLLIPAAWSSYEAVNASSNTTLPQAGPRNGGAASRSFGSQAFDSGTAQLATWLEVNGDEDARWELATTRAQNASTLIAQYGLSVMAIGGFSGSDPTITAAEFGEYVANGDVRYVLVTAGGPGGGGGRGVPTVVGGAGVTAASADAAGANAVMAAVQAVCEPVTEGLPSEYQGAIYDCTGKAEALGN
jgi:4-amino-4-deoxy-L-arabinose transferase-like glycosyltransferase